MSAVHGINSLRPITVYHERREHACVPRRHAGRRHLPDGIHAPVQPVHKPRPVCAQSHGRKCESGSRRRFEPASAESNVDCHDIHAIAAEPDGFRSQFTFPGVGPQHGSHAIAVEIDSRPQVVMAIRLNETLRASVGSTDAPNRVLDDSVCRTEARTATVDSDDITLASKKLILTRRASEGSASEPSLARRVSMCKDTNLSCRGNKGTSSPAVEANLRNV